MAVEATLSGPNGAEESLDNPVPQTRPNGAEALRIPLGKGTLIVN
jgi:hypothetical protein